MYQRNVEWNMVMLFLVLLVLPVNIMPNMNAKLFGADIIANELFVRSRHRLDHCVFGPRYKTGVNTVSFPNLRLLKIVCLVVRQNFRKVLLF